MSAKRAGGLAILSRQQALAGCDVRQDAIVLLTVIHGSMDLPNRLAELQSVFAAEVELLALKLHSRKLAGS